jgi:putative flippase GtrA
VRRLATLLAGRGTAATFLRYLATGGVNTVASLSLYWLLLTWLRPQAAYALSFAAGVCLGYLLHSRFAFRARPRWRSFAAWPLVSLAGWATGALALAIALGPLGMDPRLAPLLSVLACLPVTFLLGRRVLR